MGGTRPRAATLEVPVEAAADNYDADSQPLVPAPAGRPLAIALVAPPWFTVPPKGYGGVERVVAILANGLARAGHQVTLFAPGGSDTLARLETTFEAQVPQLMGDMAVSTENTVRAYRRWRDFDVIHDHTVAGLGAAAAADLPVVHTVHGVVLPEYFSLYAALPHHVHLVAISVSQRRSLPQERPVTVIRNAVDVAHTRWSDRPGDYLLFVGRASPDKGPLEAVEIARRAGMPLRMLIKVNEPPEREYFAHIRHALKSPGIEYDLEVSEEEKQEAYAGAFATLFPISWPEPFGLVMIESMAAGTPVIAFRHGAVTEVVEHGVTGIICQDVDSAVEALSVVPTLDRAACRARVERLFGAETAVAAHEALYGRLIRREVERPW